MRHHAETSSTMTAPIGDRGAPAPDRQGAAVDENGPGCVATGRDRAVEGVAERRQTANGRGEEAGDSHCGSPSDSRSADAR
jgi:hypothetical protein